MRDGLFREIVVVHKRIAMGFRDGVFVAGGVPLGVDTAEDSSGSSGAMRYNQRRVGCSGDDIG